MNNILIVEADPMVAHIIQTYLHRIDNVHVLGCVSSMEEIMAVFQKELVDLILLDAYLPKKSGFDVLRQLRAKEYYGSVIMITAANSATEIKQAYAYGVIDYIIKPFQISRLDKAVKKHMTMMEQLDGKLTLTQEDLDFDEKTSEHIALPKGLNRTTYCKILDKMNENPKLEWTLRQFAKEIDISNVTIKKYIDYMVETGIVETHLMYGQVGRPEYRFFLRT